MVGDGVPFLATSARGQCVDITTDRYTRTEGSPTRHPRLDAVFDVAFDTSPPIGDTVTATFGAEEETTGDPPQERLLVPAGRRAAPAASPAADKKGLARGRNDPADRRRRPRGKPCLTLRPARFCAFCVRQ